ncbi:SIS domain-containing protein [Halocynthiibacter styelae]|uniref:SIS domain-containing protein n=1 Tax=Halocynthiibacter styelae TaxID=2761955 RepID=A0A8J7LP01_9RHOB|nr:SIS domain-containing protein [Paenihalocynthiibacter styelae]MBI1492866.1 SIS domain-containing protein [Paenihalocynthiibacter styelae]
MTASLMRQETLEIPAAAERLLSQGHDRITGAADALRAHDPRFFTSIARGSSDHVASYFKYASELMSGVPVASVGPSVASVYHRPLSLNGGASLAISQSGKSPDIIEMTRASKAAGALTLALINTEDAPLAQACDHPLDLLAGPENSVAATKSFVNSAIAALLLLAHWREDHELLNALHNLPEHLEKAVNTGWPGVAEALAEQTSLFTLGRGPGWAISNEAALKFKEVCQIHAESYSSAEVLHGPVSLVGDGFPVIAFAAGDAAESHVAGIADQIAGLGGRVFVSSPLARKAQIIDVPRTGHILTDPLVLIAGFYVMIERLAVLRGFNPDQPRHLKKVTETV